MRFRPPDFIDAEFEVVDGPPRVGDEHPTRRGWFYTGRFNRKGVPLWHKPPSRASKWVRRLALATFAVLLAIGVLSTAIWGDGTHRAASGSVAGAVAP